VIYPEFLKSNSSIIGITAPSDGRSKPVDIKRLESAKAQLESRGYSVIETASVRKSEKGRSADGRTRADELMQLIEDSACKGILCASGGDWLFEMLPFLDYAKFAENPTWLEGMSDPTGLTFTMTTISDVAAVYCANAGEFGMQPWDETLENNLAILEGKNVIQKSTDSYQSGWLDLETGYEAYKKDAKTCWKLLSAGTTSNSEADDFLETDKSLDLFNDLETDKSLNVEKSKNSLQEIKFSGRLLGGCLDVIVNLCGTKYDNVTNFIEKYSSDGILWYLEAFDMTPEQLAFSLWELKEAGWFKYVKGFVFGRPAMLKDEYSSVTYDEAIMSVLGEFNVPVINNADIGHRPPHLTVINGAVGTIRFSNGRAELVTEFI
jgi:muramoyltetrapeptide carboxypeptidase LdcA involved in peptidoglycan recycling